MDNGSLLMLFAGYLIIVRFSRYRRRDSVARQYGYFGRQSFASMTLEDAHAIQLALAELEFPRVFSASVFFALFKVGLLNHFAGGIIDATGKRPMASLRYLAFLSPQVSC